MKDSEFIALLNLYLDQEISPLDATRLEAEVHGNPARRQTYHEYCRMQRACKLLAEDFLTETEPAPNQKIEALVTADRPGGRFGLLTAMGALAAAACLAIVFVNRTRDPAGASSTPIVQENSVNSQMPAVMADGGASRGIVQAVSVPVAHPAMTANPLLLSSRAQADAMFAAAVEQTDNQFEWMRTVQLAPLPQRVSSENLRFETPVVVPVDGSRTYRSPESVQDQVEWVGFKFNK
jgi:hypothetical protein